MKCWCAKMTFAGADWRALTPICIKSARRVAREQIDAWCRREARH